MNNIFDPRIEEEIWNSGSMWMWWTLEAATSTVAPWRPAWPPRTPLPAVCCASSPPSPHPCSRARVRGTYRTWPGPSPLWTCGSSTRWGGPKEDLGGKLMKTHENSWNIEDFDRKMTWGVSRQTWWILPGNIGIGVNFGWNMGHDTGRYWDYWPG